MPILERFKTPDRREVGHRVEQVRAAFDLDKGEFARLIGLDPSSYSKVIKGAAALRAEHAYVISERFGVPMDFLYRGRLIDLPRELATMVRSK